MKSFKMGWDDRFPKVGLELGLVILTVSAPDIVNFPPASSEFPDLNTLPQAVHCPLHTL